MKVDLIVQKELILQLTLSIFVSYLYTDTMFLETVRERNNPNAKLKTVSVETKEILAELERDYKPAKNSEKDEASMQKADKFNAVCIIHKKLILSIREVVLLLICIQAHYSTGAVAAGFTSTIMPAETIHQAAVIAEDLVRYERVKKKGTYRLLLTAEINYLFSFIFFFAQDM